MIVYGDSAVEMGIDECIAGLRCRLLNAPHDLAGARELLIFAGQLEQAAQDADLRCADGCRALTAAAADIFLAALRGSSAPRAQHVGRTALDGISRLSKADGTPRLRLRTPEGFAWYGLYPDAYVQAAEGWARRSPPLRVLVVGIRSIGTTLAAVVTATLRARGFEVANLTVRPQGHPFRRKCDLPIGAANIDRALVVDEGPGLSGSSIASVAEALVRKGLAKSAITFFPGHGNGPGDASGAAWQWWSAISAEVVVWDNLRIGRHLAPDVLRQAAIDLLGEPVRRPLEDIGRGGWCESGVCDDMRGKAPMLEQPKLLAHGASGRKLLFKFSGLAPDSRAVDGRLQPMSQVQACRLRDLSERGFSVAPAADVHGWLALPWLEGRPLQVGDMNKDMLGRLGEYVRQAAGPPLNSCDAQSAFIRLREMLVVNARELLGDAAAACATRGSDAVGPIILSLELPTYGDGRMAPHEWIRVSQHALKVDAAGHEHDHTVIGSQPVLWDIAGAAVEWGFDQATARQLAEICRVGAIREDVLVYYRAAYAAFRAGVAHLCASSEPVAARRRALRRAIAHYRDRLATDLAILRDAPSAPAQPARAAPTTSRSAAWRS